MSRRSGFRKTAAVAVAAAAASTLGVALVDATSSQAALPGRNGLIAWSQFSSGSQGTGIFVVRADGSGFRRILKGVPGFVPGRLSWSPDGRRLAYEDGSRVVVVDANGRGARVLARAPRTGITVDVDWSPDGRWIAYGAGPDARDLYVVPAKGGTPRRLTRTPGYQVWGSAWLPDGRSILSVRSPIHKVDAASLVLVDVTTGRSRVVDPDPPSLIPDLSPDGSRLAYHACIDYCHVHVSGLDGSQPRRLSDLDHDDYAPVWSPDGTAVAFYRSYEVIDNSSRKQIMVIPVNGDGSATILREVRGKVTDLSWQPLPDR